MTLFKRTIPPRAAFALVALVLIASIVYGREQQAEPPAQPEPARPARQAERATPADTLANLDIARLKRAARPDNVVDALAPRSVPAPAIVGTAAPAAATQPAAAPGAPALPFSYLGKMVDGGKTTVFLARGAELLNVVAGSAIDDTYKVQHITETEITFLFLPLGAQQALPLPAAN